MGVVAIHYRYQDTKAIIVHKLIKLTLSVTLVCMASQKFNLQKC